MQEVSPQTKPTFLAGLSYWLGFLLWVFWSTVALASLYPWFFFLAIGGMGRVHPKAGLSAFLQQVGDFLLFSYPVAVVGLLIASVVIWWTYRKPWTSLGLLHWIPLHILAWLAAGALSDAWK